MGVGFAVSRLMWYHRRRGSSYSPERILLRHDHNILCVYLDLGHFSGDELLAESKRVAAVLDEVPLFVEGAVCSLLGLHMGEMMT